MSAVWEEKRRAFAARMTTAGFDPDPANAGTVLDTALEENRVRIRALAEAVARDEQALAEREALPSMIEEWTARREAHTLAEKAREERERSSSPSRPPRKRARRLVWRISRPVCPRSAPCGRKMPLSGRISAV